MRPVLLGDEEGGVEGVETDLLGHCCQSQCKGPERAFYLRGISLREERVCGVEVEKLGPFNPHDVLSGQRNHTRDLRRRSP